MCLNVTSNFVLADTFHSAKYPLAMIKQLEATLGAVMTMTPDQPCTTPSDCIHVFATHSTVCTYVSRLSLLFLYHHRLVSALSIPSLHMIT